MLGIINLKAYNNLLEFMLGVEFFPVFRREMTLSVIPALSSLPIAITKSINDFDFRFW